MGMSVSPANNVIPGPATVSGALTVTGAETVGGTFQHNGANVGFYGKPSVAQQGAIGAPTAPGAVYAQAEAQSAVTAINSIRAALTALGLTL